jgi:predicted RNase H-like HicB family nuclease/predicted RNA binding protein YcfA (HicA-like mRNA interferase family)
MLGFEILTSDVILHRLLDSGCSEVRRRASQVLLRRGCCQMIVPGHSTEALPVGTIAAIRRPWSRAESSTLMRSHCATFTYDESDRVWLVEFPALAGCHTYGETLEEARSNALEALQVWLDDDAVTVDEDIRPTAAAADAHLN